MAHSLETTGGNEDETEVAVELVGPVGDSFVQARVKRTRKSAVQEVMRLPPFTLEEFPRVVAILQEERATCVPGLAPPFGRQLSPYPTGSTAFGVAITTKLPGAIT
jgi:hypothetical protein